MKIPFAGLSMYPLLAGGRDEVIIAAVSGRHLKRGDIVLYQRKDGTHVLHRIHHINDAAYYMLGDAQTWIEGPVREEEVLAVVTEIIRKEKSILCSNSGYRFISELWLLLRPIRPQLIRIFAYLPFLRKLPEFLFRRWGNT
ncbi:S26 family signal peptidase [Phosphitispora fastidiosa]|uniref:S26 family signal peptidase n=1 Tax=Phosphitispora fastidiosa TaxID=2837202 RepID=UPI001E3E8B11|nr:S26 family signal peptidase [Phosphitispora fastidiosa]MBU7007240.1 hypothetical protein [Phosphitispora fastidiosa]